MKQASSCEVRNWHDKIVVSFKACSMGASHPCNWHAKNKYRKQNEFDHDPIFASIFRSTCLPAGDWIKVLIRRVSTGSISLLKFKAYISGGVKFQVAWMDTYKIDLVQQASSEKHSHRILSFRKLPQYSICLSIYHGMIIFGPLSSKKFTNKYILFFFSFGSLL